MGEDRGGVFSHWSRSGGSGSFGGSQIALAESRHLARADGQVPPDDTFTAPTRDYEVAFHCCGVGGAGSSDLGSGSSKGTDTTVLLLGGCAVFAVAALLSTVLSLKCYNARQKKAAVCPPFKAAGAAADFVPGTVPAIGMYPPRRSPSQSNGNLALRA